MGKSTINPAVVGKHSTDIAALKNDLGIVEDGDTATHTIAQGQYVIWQGALYTADAAIASGTTLAASGGNKNLTAVENGGLNALNSKTAYTMGYLVKAMVNSTGNEVEFTFATTENRVTIVVTVGGQDVLSNTAPIGICLRTDGTIKCTDSRVASTGSGKFKVAVEASAWGKVMAIYPKELVTIS